MKKYIFITALAVLSLAACNKEKDFAPVSGTGEFTIVATRDASTRTVVQPDGKTLWWSAAEEIDVFYDGVSGVFTGQNDSPAATATFKGTLDIVPDGQKDIIAVYPSSPVNSVDSEGRITLEVPAVQNAAEGTFADGVFPAAAVSKSTSTTFMNVAGGVKFSVGEDDVTAVEFASNGSEPLAGVSVFAFENGEPVLEDVVNPSTVVTVPAPTGGFQPEKSYYAVLLPGALNSGITITLYRGSSEPIVIASDKAQTVKRSVIGKIGELKASKELDIETVWALFSSSESAWNDYFGGTAATDRNIAMDDEYVYIAESAATPKLWAISIADHKDVKAVNIEGVSGGVFPLCCPRVIKNTDPNVNGGKDVLVCGNLTRGGEEPKMYMWNNGIDNAPHAITLQTWATGSWYGDTFTVSGTLQDGILFFDKTDGAGNGVVTFNLKGVPGEKLYLLKRIAFNDALGGHSGVCAYYPFPGNDNSGVYSPGRGVEARGQHATFTGDLKSEGNAAYVPTLTPLQYTEGRNGFILAYNYLEWNGKRYVIYGKQPDASNGYVYVLEGDATTDWLDIINSAPVKFRRDLAVVSGNKTSPNSGMDVTARIINGELYFAAQKQNVACGLYKLCYK